MNVYYKNIFLLFALIIVGCEESNINPLESLSFHRLEFQITGGFAGIQHQTTISENGEVVFTHFYKNHKYIITKMLSKEQLDSLNIILIESKIFDLENEYKPNQPVIDGFTYKINYFSLDGQNKNIIIEAGAELPEELKTIVRKLCEINTYVQSNPNYGTLTSIWDEDEIIKRWIFPDIILEKNVYYYRAIKNSDTILSYFEDIKKNVGYNILYLTQDSLYSIYDGGTDYGYFTVHEVYPTKLWYNYFQVDLSIVRNAGLVQSTNEWYKMNILFNKTYVYVIDKIEDNGKAIKLRLIPGKPYNY